MAPVLLTPPSSGHETDYSPLASRASRVNKSRPSRRSISSLKSASPKFTWAKRHRLTLRVCYELGLEPKDRLRVFNAIYREDCVTAGFQDGIKQGPLGAQWQERRKTTCQPWQEVMVATEAELASYKRDIDACLEPNASSPFEDLSQAGPTLDDGRRLSSSQKRTPSRNPRAPSGKRPSSRRRPQPVQTPNTATQANRATTSNTRQVASQRKRRCASRGFPEDEVISEDRTRNIKGKEVPVISPDDPPYEAPNPVPEAEAHTSVPELLFRYYHRGAAPMPETEHCPERPGFPSTAGYNGGRKGFLCAKYMSLPHGAPPPHHCSSPHLRASALSHLTGTRITSELISVSSSLYFEMRAAARKVAAGKSDVRISMIRGSGLGREKIYHSMPFHQRFKANKDFLGGTWRNPASHEYWVWANIPSTAVTHDFSLADLEEQLTRIPSMYQALRFDKLGCGMNNEKMQTEYFMDNPIHLTYDLVIGLAEFLPHIGITTNSPDAYLAKFVSEFIRGWKIQLGRKTEADWNKFAGIFATVLNHHCNTGPPNALQYAHNAQAFLTGLQHGMGEMNWHLDTNKKNKMLRKIARLGMTCSILLVDEVEIPIDQADISDENQNVEALCADGADGDEEEDGSISEMNTSADAVSDDTTGTSDATVASSIENIDNDLERQKNAANSTNTSRHPQPTPATPQSQPFQHRRADRNSKPPTMNVESSDDSDQEFHTPRPTSSPLWNDKNTFFVDGLKAEREIFEISDDEEEEEEEEEEDGQKEDGDFEM
ncbi:hypothetical protein D6D02_04789 [Aureobasidium pullulans]|nr:hypothetical protein D6D02_04789 [Aureobasidium pullulans]